MIKIYLGKYLLHIDYSKKFNAFFKIVFYTLLICIIILSVIPHANVVQQMSEQGDFALWDVLNKYNDVSKLAYIGEDLFGIISDKIRHIFAFLILCLCIDFSYTLLSNAIKIYLLVGYGVFIEILQHFLPYRDFDFTDIVFNSLAILLYFYLFRRFFIVRLKA